MNCSSKYPATVAETARWAKIARPAALAGLGLPPNGPSAPSQSLTSPGREGQIRFYA